MKQKKPKGPKQHNWQGDMFGPSYSCLDCYASFFEWEEAPKTVCSNERRLWYEKKDKESRNARKK